MDFSPVPISVVLRGNLAAGCTTLHEITQINGKYKIIMGISQKSYQAVEGARAPLVKQ